MSSTEFSFLSYAASWATIVGTFGYIFAKADETVAEDKKETLRRWLRGADPAGAIGFWPSTFLVAFDRIFGHRHWSWRCFWRSCIASILAVFVITSLWVSLDFGSFREFLKADGGVAFMRTFVWTSTFAIVVNFIPDYVSLLETRFLLHLVEKKGRFLLFLLLDVLATALISILAIGGLAWIMTQEFHVAVTAVPHLGSFSDGVVLFAIQSADGGSYLSVPMAIFFYSAFSTSVWLWIYGLAALAVRLAGRFDLGVTYLRSAFDIDDKPFRSIGFVVMILLTLGFLVALPFAAFA